VLQAVLQAGRQPERACQAKRTWQQADWDRLTCSSRQRATGEGRQAGRGHGGRQAKPEAKLPDDGCV
jgi:hypothetical protein